MNNMKQLKSIIEYIDKRQEIIDYYRNFVKKNSGVFTLSDEQKLGSGKLDIDKICIELKSHGFKFVYIIKFPPEVFKDVYVILGFKNKINVPKINNNVDIIEK